MTKEEKDLLMKDLCARLPYGVKFTLSGNNIYTMKGIDLIVTDEGDWEYAVTAKGITPIEIKYIKPYLCPMSSMTEEERYDYRHRLGATLNSEGESILFVYVEDFPTVMNWLNAHHFDYNGLIEKDLALEAPEDMYPHP